MFHLPRRAPSATFSRMSLRVLHIDMGKAWRGGQRQVYLLARAQRDAGHEPLVVAPPDSPLLRRARGAGLAVSAVGAAGDWDLRAAGRVVQRLKTWRADIVHAHDARAHAIAIDRAGRTPTNSPRCNATRGASSRADASSTGSVSRDSSPFPVPCEIPCWRAAWIPLAWTSCTPVFPRLTRIIRATGDVSAAGQRVTLCAALSAQ